jgi:hypothetical protein
MGLIYLASPYSHEDPAVREERFRIVCRAAARLMAQGNLIFSPIAHSHPIALAGQLPTEWDYWEQYDRAHLLAACELWVLKLAGWQVSRGIACEIEIMKGLGKPVKFIEPADADYQRLAISEDWLRGLGFKWETVDRDPNKHWTLGLGGAIEHGDSDNLMLELSIGLDGEWFCWVRADYCGRYTRFVHVRHVRYQDEVIALIEGLVGQKFKKSNVWYGSLRTAADAQRLAADEKSLHVRLAKSWGAAAERETGQTDQAKLELVRP